MTARGPKTALTGPLSGHFVRGDGDMARVGILIELKGAVVKDQCRLIARRPTSISNRWLAQSLAKVDELYRRQGDPMCLDVALALV